MLHHLALTASGLNRSLPFYDAVLSCLGYTRTLTRNQLAAWEGPHPEILLYQAKAGQEGAAHTTYDPGIHHIAFRAETRAVVDQVQECIIKLKGTVLVQHASIRTTRQATMPCSFLIRMASSSK